MAKIHAMVAAATVALMTMSAGAAPALAQLPPPDMMTLNKPPPANPPAVQPWAPGQPVPWVRSIPVDLAITAAKAALAACRGKRASVGVVDHDGRMIVLYVDDYATMVGQKALPQKLHAAVIRQTATQELANHSDGKNPGGPEIDWEAKIIDRFNDGALISPGAIPFLVGTQPNRSFVGAIGVAGASPPGSGVGTVNEDQTCALAGYNAVKDQLK
jgi:uncharacterized protein GlcG (DUF336 family)